MTKFSKTSSGKYSVSGKTYEALIGTRAQVWHGTAKKTSGGLTKKNLMKNKHGHIVSKRKHALGKKSIKHLFKLGFKPKKGTMRLFKKGDGLKKHRGGTGSAVGLGNLGAPLDRALVAAGGRRRMRGGMVLGGPLSPHAVSGLSGSENSLDVQVRAGMGN
jgi:hypothetical protein